MPNQWWWSCTGIAAVAGLSSVLAATMSVTSPAVTALVVGLSIAVGAWSVSRCVATVCRLSLSDDGDPIAMPPPALSGVFIACAALAGAGVVWLHPGESDVSVLVAPMMIVGAWCAVIDHHTHRIPTGLIWTGVGVIIPAIAVLALSGGQPAQAVFAAGWGLAVGAGLLTCTVITAGSPGLADVRLSVLVALVCGYLGGGTTVAAMLLYTVCAAGAVAAVLLAVRTIRNQNTGSGNIALGPFLVAGALGALALSL